MSIHNATLDIPKNPAQRRAWLAYQLRLKGLSIADLARQEDVSREAVAKAMNEPSSHLEEAIARTLERTVREIFPERYDHHGRRLNRTREKQRTTHAPRSNVKAVGDA